MIRVISKTLDAQGLMKTFDPGVLDQLKVTVNKLINNGGTTFLISHEVPSNFQDQFSKSFGIFKYFCLEYYPETH